MRSEFALPGEDIRARGVSGAWTTLADGQLIGFSVIVNVAGMVPAEDESSATA